MESRVDEPLLEPGIAVISKELQRVFRQLSKRISAVLAELALPEGGLEST